MNTKSGLQKLVEEYQAKQYPTRHGMYERMLVLLKEEQSNPSTTTDGLVEEFKNSIVDLFNKCLAYGVEDCEKDIESKIRFHLSKHTHLKDSKATEQMPKDIKVKCPHCGLVLWNDGKWGGIVIQDIKENPTAPAVDAMVDRFLCWKLPDDFGPDGGIAYTLSPGFTPIGTNLLTATQAKAMFEYCLAPAKGVAK